MSKTPMYWIIKSLPGGSVKLLCFLAGSCYVAGQLSQQTHTALWQHTVLYCFCWINDWTEQRQSEDQFLIRYQSSSLPPPTPPAPQHPGPPFPVHPTTPNAAPLAPTCSRRRSNLFQYWNIDPTLVAILGDIEAILSVLGFFPCLTHRLDRSLLSPSSFNPVPLIQSHPVRRVHCL